MQIETFLRHMARRIKQRMERRGWSSNRLADFAGIARGGMSEVLRGKRAPSLRTLLRIADALECAVKDLLPD